MRFLRVEVRCVCQLYVSVINQKPKVQPFNFDLPPCVKTFCRSFTPTKSKTQANSTEKKNLISNTREKTNHALDELYRPNSNKPHKPTRHSSESSLLRSRRKFFYLTTALHRLKHYNILGSRKASGNKARDSVDIKKVHSFERCTLNILFPPRKLKVMIFPSLN